MFTRKIIPEKYMITVDKKGVPYIDKNVKDFLCSKVADLKVEGGYNFREIEVNEMPNMFVIRFSKEFTENVNPNIFKSYEVALLSEVSKLEKELR
ncbi:MAG: hypothetical protein NTY20_02350 [Candidatus Aenigmarchaeota archaeon]|nr:hypothetical protein [Candidatus Aenigmarchaeota archaeon]